MPVQYAIEVVNFTTTDRALNCSSGAIQKRHEAAWSCPSNYNETIPTKRERQFDSKKKTWRDWNQSYACYEEENEEISTLDLLSSWKDITNFLCRPLTIAEPDSLQPRNVFVKGHILGVVQGCKGTIGLQILHPCTGYDTILAYKMYANMYFTVNLKTYRCPWASVHWPWPSWLSPLYDDTLFWKSWPPAKYWDMSA